MAGKNDQSHVQYKENLPCYYLRTVWSWFLVNFCSTSFTTSVIAVRETNNPGREQLGQGSRLSGPVCCSCMQTADLVPLYVRAG